jgi:hypothetical protein
MERWQLVESPRFHDEDFQAFKARLAKGVGFQLSNAADTTRDDGTLRNYEAWLSDNIRVNSFLIIHHHLGLDHGIKSWRTNALNVVIHAAEYFFGSFWETYNPNATSWDVELHNVPFDKKKHRSEMLWHYEYRYGLFLALLLDAEDDIQLLLQWPSRDMEEDIDDKQLKPFHIVQARILLNDYTPAAERMATSIRKARPKKYKLLLDCLEAVLKKNSIAFAASMKAYLAHALKAEIDLDATIDDKVSLDGTIVWHFARRSGLTLPTLTEKEQSLVITKESLRY